MEYAARICFYRLQKYFFIIAFTMNDQRIAVVSPQITSRLRYTALEFFERRLGLNVDFWKTNGFTSSGSYLLTISYGEPSETDWFIPASGLLQDGASQEIWLGGSLPDFQNYLQGLEQGVFKQDLFSGVFWLLSRMEEYDHSCVDLHGRYDTSRSLLVKAGLETIPWIEDWAGQIARRMESRGFFFKPHLHPGLEISFDIDHPTLYKEKGWLRNTAGALRDLKQANFNAVVQRLAVGMGLRPDPYITYSEISRQLSGYPALFFFWLGNYGAHDKGLPFLSHNLQTWFFESNRMGRVGIHPSYRVMTQPSKLQEEMERFYQLAGHLPTISRFHYLRFRLPDSYRLLSDAGILHDYSMGFSDRLGFRAGTSMPFSWYDISREEISPLLIHPFAAMDSAAFFQLKLSAAQYLEKLSYLLAQTLQKGFGCHLIFHNEFPSWPSGWNNLLEKVLQTNPK